MGRTGRWGAVLAAVGFAAGCATQTGVEAASELPVGPTEVGVLFGVDVLSEWRLVHSSQLGEVGAVRIEPGRVRIVSNQRALLTAAGGERKVVPFQEADDWTTSVDLEPVDVAPAGPVRYASRGGNWHPVATYDGAGRILWRSDFGPDRLAYGDIEGDGALDLVVGWNGKGGVQRLDAAGAEVWRVRDRNVWSVELADLDRDGIAEIVHSRADGKLVVRNADGTLRAALPVAERVAHFTLEEKRAPEDAPVAVYAGHQGLHRVDVATGIDTLFQTIHPVFTSDVAAARVRLRPDAAELYAFLVDFGSAERSFLALYDGSGALVHETVLPVSCRALALDRSDPEGDVIAAGCQGQVVLFGRDLPLLRRALAARETLAGADSPSVADEHRELANAYLSEGRIAEAEPHAWRSIEIFEKKGGTDAPGSAESQAVLAHVLEKRGNRGDAEIRLLRALALATPADGPDHAALWIVHDGLAAFYASGGDRAKAEAHLREALAALPDEDRRTSRLRAELAYRLADLLLADGRPAAAEEAIAIAIEHDTYAFGAEHAEVQTDRALAERIRAAAAATPSPASPDGD